MGVEQRVVIQRPTEDSEDGFELLLTATNTINGQVTHTYQIVLILSMIAVWVTIFGVGQFETFYTHCKTIIGSIKVAKVEGIQPGAC